MTNTIRIKRRAGTGASGSPASLFNAELAFSEVDDILYYGKGTGGAGGTATSVEAIGGRGAYVTLNTTQTITGPKTFTGGINATITGNADTATALQTVRTFTFTTDVTGSTLFNGTSNVTIPLTLSNTSVTVGTFGTATSVGSFTVDAKGRLTASSNIPITFPVTSVNTKTGAVVLSTSDIAEGTNLYYTDARVRLNRLDQMAQPTSALILNSQNITLLADPINAQDAATKSYVDIVAQGAGNAPFTSVRAIATSSLTLSGLQTVDGVSLLAGDRVLASNNGINSGIYVVNAGPWTRALDADISSEFKPGKQVFVNEGTSFSDTVWSITNDGAITLGTTIVTFTQASGLGQVVAGPGLSKSGNTISAVAGTGITLAGNNIALTGQALALHNLATNGLIIRNGTGTVISRSIAVTGTGISITNGDGVAANPSITLSAALSSVGDLTPLADRLPYYTSATTAALTTLTATGRSLIGIADVAAGRTLLGLGTMALQNAVSVAITGGTIHSVTITNSILDGGTF